MTEKRLHSRIPLQIEIKISHPKIGEKVLITKDFSEGGLFVIIDPEDLPGIGEIVMGQVQDAEREMPIVKMEIVRVDDNGWGLRYLDKTQTSH